MRKWILSVFFVALLNALFAQDIHWSQFIYSPLQLSPAQTGAFDGKIRAAGNYRNQWRQVSNPFSTLALSGEVNAPFKLNRWAVGLSLFHDVAGTTALTHDRLGLNVAYHLPLNKDSTFILSGGVAANLNQEYINTDNITTDNQFVGNRFQPDIPINEVIDGRPGFYPNGNFGLTFTSVRSSKEFFSIGYSLQNIIKQQVNWLISAPTATHNRHNIFLNSSRRIGTNWLVGPAVLFSSQREFSEFVLGADVTYELQQSSYHYRAIFMGMWTRFNDAGFLTVGGHYDNWRLGLSYDINYSPFTRATNYRGGFEVSLIYILRDILPKRKRYKNCPDYL